MESRNGKKSSEMNETTFSLLEKPNIDLKDNPKRRKCLNRLLVVLIIVTILVGLLMFLSFSDYSRSFRCKVTDTLGIQLVDCVPVATLDRLTSPNITDYWNSSTSYSIERANMTACNTQDNGTISSKCAETLAASEREKEYRAQAEHAWDVAYKILHDTEGWRLYKGASLRKGRVYTKIYEDIGRVSKLQVQLDSTQEQLQKLLIDGMDQFPSWYLALDDVQIVESFSEELSVVLMVAKGLAGGIVAARDFLDVSYWKKIGNMTLVAQAGTTHPFMPDRKGFVRGFHKAGGMMFQPVKNKPGKMLLEWAFAMDVKMWIPGFVLDQAQSGSMLDFTSYVKDKLRQLNRQ